MAGLSLLAYAPAEAAPRAEAPCHQILDHSVPQPMTPAKAPVKAMACCATAALPAPPQVQARLLGPELTPQHAIRLGESIADGRHPSPEPRPPRA